MIRSLTVIGHGTNLIEHHINHYSKYVDEIYYIVYNTENSPRLNEEVQEIIKDYKNVKVVRVHQDRVFDWERVTMLYNYVTNKEPNDWWVICDIDEFHLYPDDNLKKLISNCNEYGWDMVRGGFIDRIGRGGEFSEITSESTLWEQFPNAGFFRYPMSNANPNKICVMKGYVEITSGQHYAKIEGQTTWRWQGWNHPLINPHSFVQVHHFKWDKSCVDRIKAVADIRQDYAYSNEYQTMYENLRKNRFKIDLIKTEYQFELGLTQPEFRRYRNWNKLIKKIISV
jgi:hypothetical protein